MPFTLGRYGLKLFHKTVENRVRTDSTENPVQQVFNNPSACPRTELAAGAVRQATCGLRPATW